ncbi:ribokinase [Lactobacillus psittaci]|uniref:Ribokinase n=1 Tax=Lactobacillus psittaci DSM 15354 TaxID=1122152 RepID=A0A0R1SAS3_9LACO|nr:ribokinase [Lactobacillus psittaci]KRL63818.1 ribokinase [Lactobacillus psittaci DSM 15354]
MKKIVVVGSSNVDTTLHVKDFPKPGETINALDITSAGGGKGANQAIAAAKGGSDTNFINRVGEDSDGRFILSQLKSYGVDTTYVQTTSGKNTGHAYINLNEAGQNNIIIDHGANYELSIEDIDAAEDLISESDAVITQFETPLDVAIEAFKLAKKHAVVTILNPAPAIENIPNELLKLTDLITPNETEAGVITGIEISDETSLKEASDKLHGLGIENVVITNGAKGSYLSTKKVEKMVPAFKVEAVDTTGAGDTFLGFLASQLETDFSNIEEAAIFASRASSIAVSRLGAQPSIPTFNEVKEAMGKNNG